jgi:hypothetical protein
VHLFEKVAYTVTGTAELIGYNDREIHCRLLVQDFSGNSGAVRSAKSPEKFGAFLFGPIQGF